MPGRPLWIMRNPQKWIALTILILVGISNAFALWLWIPLVYLKDDVELADRYKDALHMAVELGRLDIISALLAVAGVMLGVFAILSFGYIQYRAEKVASEIADKAARKYTDEYFKKEGVTDSGRVTVPTVDVDEVDVTQRQDEGAGNHDA